MPNKKKQALTAGAKQEPNGRFAKGQSGNPGGRAKMPSEVREMLTAKAEDAVKSITSHLDNEDPRIALKAAELLLDRAYGKPQQASEHIQIDLPADTKDVAELVAMHAALLRATASGAISVSDAREVSGLFENHRKMIETSELEQRLAALEKTAK